MKRLRKLFGTRRSLFVDRYDFLRIEIEKGETLQHLINRIKAGARKYKFHELANNNFIV